MTLFQVDLKALKHLNRRVAQLKGYRGTPDELEGDDDRLADARKRANRFLVRMVMFHLGGE